MSILTSIFPKTDIAGNKTTSILTENRCCFLMTDIDFFERIDVVLLPATLVFLKIDVVDEV